MHEDITERREEEREPESLLSVEMNLKTVITSLR